MTDIAQGRVARRPSEADAIRHSRGARRAPARAARVHSDGRAGCDRLDRLYGSWQFRDEYPGRRQIWLHPALGRPPRQCHRDAVSGLVGEARDRNRPQPCRNMPRAIAAPARLDHVDRQRDRRDGDGPRRISWRRDRSFASFQPAAGLGHGRHRDHHLWNSHFRAARFPIDRIDHRRARRDNRPLLRHRTLHRSGRLGVGRIPYGHAPASGRGGGHDRRRHHRRHRHAACDLSAFRV